MSAPRTGQGIPDVLAMVLTVVTVIVLLSWASAIYGGPA